MLSGKTLCFNRANYICQGGKYFVLIERLCMSNEKMFCFDRVDYAY